MSSLQDFLQGVCSACGTGGGCDCPPVVTEVDTLPETGDDRTLYLYDGVIWFWDGSAWQEFPIGGEPQLKTVEVSTEWDPVMGDSYQLAVPVKYFGTDNVMRFITDIIVSEIPIGSPRAMDTISIERTTFYGNEVTLETINGTATDPDNDVTLHYSFMLMEGNVHYNRVQWLDNAPVGSAVTITTAEGSEELIDIEVSEV